MKKALMILGIIFLVIVIIGIIFFAVTFISLNKEKGVISAKSFSRKMEDKGYEIYDITNQFAQYENYIEEAYVAKEDEYQIEFYELTDLENAIDMYGTNKLNFERQKGDNSAYVSKDGKNFSTYSLQANGKYKYLSRVENTIIYIDVDEEYKDTIKETIKELGY